MTPSSPGIPSQPLFEGPRIPDPGDLAGRVVHQGNFLDLWGIELKVPGQPGNDPFLEGLLDGVQVGQGDKQETRTQDHEQPHDEVPGPVIG